MSNPTIFLLLTITITITSLIHSSTSVTPDVLIARICMNTSNPFFCNDILSSSPGGQSGTTKDLDIATLGYILDAGPEPQKYISQELQKPDTDFNVRLALVVCKADYEIALDYANKGKASLNSGGSYLEAKEDVAWIRRKTDECSRIVEKEAKLRDLKLINLRFSQLVEIGEAIFQHWA